MKSRISQSSLVSFILAALAALLGFTFDIVLYKGASNIVMTILMTVPYVLMAIYFATDGRLVNMFGISFIANAVYFLIRLFGGFFYNGIQLFFVLTMIAGSVLMILSSLGIIKNRIVAIIALSVMAVFHLYFTVNTLIYTLQWGQSFVYLLSEFMPVMFYASALLPFLPIFVPKAPKLTAEQYLIMLKQQYDAGAITQEEFNARKADVLNRM